MSGSASLRPIAREELGRDVAWVASRTLLARILWFPDLRHRLAS
jgi:hypothetical protein